MAKLEQPEIKHLIREIGLSTTKAKNLKTAAELLVDKHQGVVPKTFEELEALSGVGHKTASVVMSQAFGIPTFPVDTHIHRLMWRWGLTNGKNVEQTEKDAKRLFAKKYWNKLHLQIIFYGREYSPARGFDINKDIITKTIGRKRFLKTVL
jgi:endonuclease-3